MRHFILFALIATLLLSCGQNSGKKYLGSWESGGRRLTITEFGKEYKITECANCPFSGVLKDGVLYVMGLPCTYDDKSDHIMLDGTEYSRVK